MMYLFRICKVKHLCSFGNHNLPASVFWWFFVCFSYRKIYSISNRNRSQSFLLCWTETFLKILNNPSLFFQHQIEVFFLKNFNIFRCSSHLEWSQSLYSYNSSVSLLVCLLYELSGFQTIFGNIMYLTSQILFW